MTGSASLLAVAAVALGLALLVGIGRARWDAASRRFRARLRAARRPVAPHVFDLAELARLPEPVVRFFRSALTPGQPLVSEVHLEHSGTFNSAAGAARWRAFRSEQLVVTARPGFHWDARIAMMPGLPVLVRDAYVEGAGILRAEVLGLVPVADMRGGEELARGELMRFLAETSWYPTALLPSQGVRWEGVDDHTALAMLTDGDVAVTLHVRFEASGLIGSVQTDARGRIVGANVVPTRWGGRFWNHVPRDGMRVPLDAEVAWFLPEGEQA